MELNTVEDVNALTEYQKLEQINAIEAQIKRMSLLPVIVCGILMLWAFWATWSDILWSPMHLVLIAIAIGVVGQSNVKRTDLVRQLFELKYANK